MYMVIASGYQLQDIPPSKFQINIEYFIKNHIVLDKSSKVKISKVIYVYKQMYYNGKILNKEENKTLNKKISDALRKFLKAQKDYYIGCKLI